MRIAVAGGTGLVGALVIWQRSSGPAAGLAPELAGPQEHDLVDLARRVARARGQRRPVAGIRVPGAAGHGYRRAAADRARAQGQADFR